MSVYQFFVLYCLAYMSLRILPNFLMAFFVLSCAQDILICREATELLLDIFRYLAIRGQCMIDQGFETLLIHNKRTNEDQ
jgi:hypothetical protein